MRRALKALGVFVVLCLAAVGVAWPITASYPNLSAQTSGDCDEVLVDNTTVTAVPASDLAGRRSIEIQNLGPNAIYCSLGGEDPVLTKSRKIDAAGGTWALDISDAVDVECLAATADQVTGAATIVCETK